ncbi:MAG: hypothetical protein RJA70_3078, partial [Pseudomonadota bacterium]
MTEFKRRQVIQWLTVGGTCAGATGFLSCTAKRRGQAGDTVEPAASAPARAEKRRADSAIVSITELPASGSWPTPDPFLFCVHHDDRYPRSNGQFGPAVSLDGRNLG